jgi:hypothetical protein
MAGDPAAVECEGRSVGAPQRAGFVVQSSQKFQITITGEELNNVSTSDQY